MKKIMVGLAVAVAMAAVAAPLATAGAASVRNCATVVATGVRFHITMTRGTATCSTARTVLQAFMSGRGQLHGPPDGPAYLQSWTVYGWTCGHGTGGGACIRGGRTYQTARDYILAQAV